MFFWKAFLSNSTSTERCKARSYLPFCKSTPNRKNSLATQWCATDVMCVRILAGTHCRHAPLAHFVFSKIAGVLVLFYHNCSHLSTPTRKIIYKLVLYKTLPGIDVYKCVESSKSTCLVVHLEKVDEPRWAQATCTNYEALICFCACFYESRQYFTLPYNSYRHSCQPPTLPQGAFSRTERLDINLTTIQALPSSTSQHAVWHTRRSVPNTTIDIEPHPTGGYHSPWVPHVCGSHVTNSKSVSGVQVRQADTTAHDAGQRCHVGDL